MGVVGIGVSGSLYGVGGASSATGVWALRDIAATDSGWGGERGWVTSRDGKGLDGMGLAPFWVRGCVCVAVRALFGDLTGYRHWLLLVLLGV